MIATNAAQDIRAKAARLNDLARKREAKKPGRKKAIAAMTLAPAPVIVALARLDVRDMQAFEAFVTLALTPDSNETAADLLADLLSGAPRVPVSREARTAPLPKPGSDDWGPDSTPDRPEYDVDEMDASRAGLRGHLAHPEPYGPEVTRLVMVTFPSGARRPIVAYGPLSAMHRNFPDTVARLAWSDARIHQGKAAMFPGAMEVFPLKLDA